jgi:hypothetical protein
MVGGLFIHADQRQIPVATQATTASALLEGRSLETPTRYIPARFGLKHLVEKNLSRGAGQFLAATVSLVVAGAAIQREHSWPRNHFAGRRLKFVVAQKIEFAKLVALLWR